MNGLITLPIVPVRAESNECSEMTTQLLFGELVEILEITEKWNYIKSKSDNYTGWCDRKMISHLTLNELEYFNKLNQIRVKTPFCIVSKTKNNERMFLPAGSLLYKNSENQFYGYKDEIQISGSENIADIQNTENDILKIAFQFLNAPYLWGGKTILGIDCSGLVQVCFSICGILLPRDASQQVQLGELVDFLEIVKPGDLAFFENNDGKIVHVGILINSSQIIHASGWVKIEKIDSQGIISSQTGEYTHKLRIIKRLI